MNYEIVLVLTILAVALALFISEVLRMDLIALLVLCALSITGLVTPNEAISGFSNAAVITVWAMFILSEGLTKTGIANILGRQVMGIAGRREEDQRESAGFALVAAHFLKPELVAVEVEGLVDVGNPDHGVEIAHHHS